MILAYPPARQVLSDSIHAARRQAATGSWVTMIGALLLARLVDDNSQAEAILDDARRWIDTGLGG